MKHSKKKSHAKKEKRKKIDGIKIFLIIFLMLVVMLCIGNFGSSKSQEIIFILNNNDLTNELSEKMFNANNIVYMGYDDVSKFIDETIFMEGDRTIITTSSKKVAKLEIDNNTILINGSERDISSGPIKINDIVYMPISELESVYDIEFGFSEESNIATIDNLATQKKVATAKKNISIKQKKSFFSKTLDKVKKDEKIVLIEEDGQWAKVRTEKGYIGYVKLNKLCDINNEREDFKIETSNNNINNNMEKDITNEDISNFEKRQELIKRLFTEAMKKEKTNITIKSSKIDENFKRLEIETIPIFKECGLICNFNN